MRLADLYPPESVGEVPTCEQVGVLGSLCMQVGAILATETIKLVTGVGEPLLGRVLVIDALRGRTDEVPLRSSVRTGTSRAPGSLPSRTSTSPPHSPRRPTARPSSTSASRTRPPRGVIPGAITIPLDEVLADPARVGTGPLVVVCKVGARALRAARALQQAGIRGIRSHRRNGRVGRRLAVAGRRVSDGSQPGADGLISIDEHLGAILDAVIPLEASTVPISAARGRTLREPVTARVDIPVFDNSAMDGFAVLFDDVVHASPDSPVTLTVVADLPAGTEVDPPLAPGETARIMTGSPTPTAATAVVPFEDTVGGLADSLGRISVVRAPHSARRPHPPRAAPTPSSATSCSTPARRSARCRSRPRRPPASPRSWSSRLPRVAVVSTGSELVTPGTPLRRGQIPESNSELLAGLAAESGAEVVLRATVPDDGDGPRVAIAEAEALGADVVVFSGGVSAGAYEVVKNTLADRMTFTKVRMQPGKPQGFGVTDAGTLLFGLPGNPVSAAVSFEVFVRPALLRMQGRTGLGRPMIRLRAAAGWRTPPGRAQYLPVAIDRTDPARWRAVPVTAGGSHLAGGLGRAEAYAVIPADVEAVGRRRPRRCHADLMSFTHLDDAGHARMVDVTQKHPTVRAATARGFVRCSADVVAALRDGTVPKGDVLAVARIAGIQAAKRTPDLLPLAHVIGVHGAAVDLVVEDDGVAIEATVRTADRTGVEMEALTAVAVAALAVVDMVKALDKGTSIENVRIVAKTGGKSGDWVRPGEA